MKMMTKVRRSPSTTRRATEVKSKLRKRNVGNGVRKLKKQERYLKVKKNMKVKKNTKAKKRQQPKKKAAKERIKKGKQNNQKMMSLHTLTK